MNEALLSEFHFPVDWFNELSPEEIANLFDVLKELKTLYEANPSSIFPEKEKVFNALTLCPIAALKVVILGQDPYPTKGHANGLCFSVNAGVRPIPKSLQNIFKELKNDQFLHHSVQDDLTYWAEQGVLLLNSVLTVQEGKAGSHFDLGWEKVTASFLEIINRKKNNVVFLLWGAKAQMKQNQIELNKHCVLLAPHPSPLSVYRGFYGCKHFSKTNNYLKSIGEKEIAW
jgi:uracil-DNA glycosylase